VSAHLSEEWLEGVLRARSLTAEEVFLMSIDTHGQALVQDCRGNTARFEALGADGVKW